MSWNYDILLKIFEEISRDGVELMCVLDALDEAQNIDIVELVERLTVKCPLSRTKFIILSRGNVEIERVLLKYHHILLEEENTDDISRFIESGKVSLSKAIHALDFESEIEVEPSRSGIPRNSRPSRAPRRNVSKKINDQEKQELEYIGKYIQDRANGTFLWVKLVFDQLHTEVEKGIGTFGELKKRLKEYPEKLTDFYQRITTDMHCGTPIRSIKFARKTLMWVSGASELAEFSLEELWDALAVSLEEEDEQEQDKVQDAEASCTDRVAERRIPIRSFHEFRRKINGICGPLVEVLKPRTLNEHSEFTIHGGQSTVQLMHQTVKDFLSLPEAAGELHFYPDEAIQMVNHLCLRYVKLIGAIVPRLRANLRYDYGTITAAEMVEWLDDKKLLRFALHTQPRWEHHEISVYQQIFCTVLAPPEPNTLDWELVDALNDSRYFSTEKLGPQAIAAGRLFHLACSEGLVVAASNLVTITSFLPNWWKTNCRVIKHAVMLAASEVDTSSLRLGLKPATLHQAVPEIETISRRERADLSSSGRAARVRSLTEALPEDKRTSTVPGLRSDPIVWADPKDVQAKLSLESSTAGARSTTHVFNEGKYRYKYADSESESADESDRESSTTPIAAAKVNSAVGASSENKRTSLSANPNIRSGFHKPDTEVPKISAPPPSTYSTTLSGAFPKSKRTSGPARAHPDSEDESDAESAVAIPFIPTASTGVTALSTALSKAQQRMGMLAGPESESADDWDRQKTLSSFAAASADQGMSTKTPELRKTLIIPPENARISPASKPNGESKATSKVEIPASFRLPDIVNWNNTFITDKRVSTTRVSSAAERMSHSDLSPAASIAVETGDSSDPEDERRPTTFATRRKSSEQPPPKKDSNQEPWVSSAWTVTLGKHSTTTSKQQFSISTKFENWCSLVDKTCGGKAHMLRSKRRKLYGKDELPYTEDIEEAIGVVLQKFREVDYDVPQVADESMELYTRPESSVGLGAERDSETTLERAEALRLFETPTRRQSQQSQRIVKNNDTVAARPTKVTSSHWHCCTVL